MSESEGSPKAPEAATADPPPVVLLECERGPDQKVVWALKTYKGARFVDGRVHTRGPDGLWHPTGKGISVRLRELRPVVGALVAAMRQTGTETQPGGLGESLEQVRQRRGWRDPA